MPYSQSHKQKSRQRILQSAVKLFTHRGFEQTSIDEVMADAGLTRGAFYAHFRSKQDLYAQAIANTGLFSFLVKSRQDVVDEKEWLAKVIKAYLHRKHVTDTELPCPLAFLATDVALREPEARRAYTQVYQAMNKLLQRSTRAYAPCDSDTVMAVTAMMIGGVAIARTVDEGSLRNQLLKSCRKMALELLNAEDRE